MTKPILAAAALAALALLAGCGAPAKGTVADRKTTVSCIGTTASCKPRWKLLITDTSHRHPVYTDRPDSGWTNVTEAEYERCPVGAAWPDCKAGGR